jgi:hypothetical protein
MKGDCAATKKEVHLDVVQIESELTWISSSNRASNTGVLHLGPHQGVNEWLLA